MAKRINPHHLTTTKPRLIAVVPTAILTLVLLSLCTAPAYEQGTYYSAKDPDLAPYPFNPYPHLPVVEVAPGIFVVDDLTVPDTPEQLASRIAREEARKAAEKLGPETIKQMAEQREMQRVAAWNQKRAEAEARATAIEAGLLPMPMSAAAASGEFSLTVTSVGGLLRFELEGAEPYASFDLYFLKDLLLERWQWRRVYCGIPCDAAGTAMFELEPPEPAMGYFVALSANDTDNNGIGDGLTDGYEAWFDYNGQFTDGGLMDSDGDGMSDGWEVQYGLNPMDATGINGATADPDGDGYNNKAEHDSYFSSPTYVDASYDPLKPQLPYGSNRPVVTISAGTSPCSYSATFTITRWPDYGADLSSPLTVYYAVGGNLTYGIDYTLDPAPLTSDYPRIFSVVIKSGEASTNVNVNPTGWPLNSPTMAVALTPYGVGASPQVPAQVGGQWQNYAGKWDYVVDLKGQQDRVTLTMPAPPSFSDLPLLSAVCGPNSIFLHWDIIPPEFGGLEGYVVNRRTTPAGVYEEIYSTTDPDEKSYEDTSVVQGVAYCYLVVAKVRDPGTWELCELPSNEECLSTCDPPPCNEPSISGWIFTDHGFIAGEQQGAFRLYEDPNDVSAGPWTLQESSGSLNVRMDYEDDYNCELYNENIQAATAEAVITVAHGCPAQLTVDWNGMVEQHDTGYDRMWLFVDENQIDYAQSTQRQQGCAPMVSTNGYQSALLQPGFHLLRIETDTGDDGNYQSSAFYEFDIDFD